MFFIDLLDAVYFVVLFLGGAFCVFIEHLFLLLLVFLTVICGLSSDDLIDEISDKVLESLLHCELL